VIQYSRLPSWPDFRAALPVKTTIADAQALALRGECFADATHSH
jgi:hypothetical protein